MWVAQTCVSVLVFLIFRGIKTSTMRFSMRDSWSFVVVEARGRRHLLMLVLVVVVLHGRMAVGVGQAVVHVIISVGVIHDFDNNKERRESWQSRYKAIAASAK